MQTKAGSPHISGRLGRIQSGQYILELADMLGLYSLLVPVSKNLCSPLCLKLLIT